MPNDYLKKLSAQLAEVQRTGERIGEQRTMDLTMIYLHRQGWGEKRIKDYFDGLNAINEEYAEAFALTQEQEIYQERMDAELAAVIPDCLPFAERYPEFRTMGYDNPVREQKHIALKKRRRKR